jgi:hypothetical protein
MMTPARLERELDARLDGPHADEHTAATAALAAEAVRFLNHATGPHAASGLRYPATVYRIADDLSSAAYRMTQLFGQLGGWLARQDAAGMLGTDDGTPAGQVVAAARVNLTSATAAATELSAYLDALHNSLATLNGRGPNRPADAS